MTSKEIKQFIKYNNIIVDEINQILHNNGIIFDKRIDIILQLMDYKFNNVELDIKDKLKTTLIDIIKYVSISKTEIFQKIFMFYGNNYLQKKLDQFYTPSTIGEFLSKLCFYDKQAIDPACGTGDLIINYTNITLWDISKEAIDMAKINYQFQHKKANFINHNTLSNYNHSNNQFDYAFLNPPFGSSTVITDKDILKNYVLGINKKKQEVGILFIERTINLLKDNGVSFIIVPNGYLGNNNSNCSELRKYLLQYRIIGILQLPQNTFSRSGTGVSTSIIIISKIQQSTDYNIFLYSLKEIGYVLNKKNTPFKYNMIKGDYVLNNGSPTILTDFDDCYNKLCSFLKDNNITNLHIGSFDYSQYDYVSTDKLDDNNILDIPRYMKIYKNVVSKYSNNRRLKDCIIYVKDEFKKDNDNEYLYLDIKQVNTPFYNGTNMIYGYELPSRAKISLIKNDIIISKLKGNITATIITEDRDDIVCSNGFCRLRPSTMKDMIIIMGNIFSQEFKIQHQSLCTGSIMETISNNDIMNILINDDINIDKYNNIIDALYTIKHEMKIE